MVRDSWGIASGVQLVLFKAWEVSRSSRIQGAFSLDHVLYTLSRMSSGLRVVSPLLLDPALHGQLLFLLFRCLMRSEDHRCARKLLQKAKKWLASLFYK